MHPKVLEQYIGGQTSRDSELLSLSKDEFSAKVINFFRACADDSVFDNCREQYHLIRCSLDHFEPYLSKEVYLDVYIEVLFSLFELFHVIASGVVRNVVEVYMLRKRKRYPAKLIKMNLFEKEAPLFTIPYDMKPPLDKGLSVQCFDHPFLLQKLEATQRLLRYGTPFKTEVYSLRTSLATLYRCLTRAIMPTIFHELVIESDFKRITAVYPTFQEQRRLNIVLVVVYVTIKKEQWFSTYLKDLDSLKMVFKTIQEPFITVSEITRFLDLSLAGETKERDIRQFCENFIKDFPGSAQSFAPRSLKHLCRCTIRQSLKISSQLPHGVFTLNIPRRLKNYLLLQRYESEFYPRYVAALSTIKRPLSDVTSSKRQKTDLS